MNRHFNEDPFLDDPQRAPRGAVYAILISAAFFAVVIGIVVLW